MSLLRLVFKEISYRPLNFCLGVISIIIAVGCFTGSLTLLRIFDLKTQQILEEKHAQIEKQMAELKDEMRKTMLKLGFNIVILPEGQDLSDWYADNYASRYMPEEYVEKLACARIMTITHLLPVLEQKVKWKEKERTVILMGVKGEVPQLHRKPKRPLRQPVPPGKIIVGYELHRSLKLKKGDKVKLLGREFTVAKCEEEKGSKEDITIYLSLAEAQELLGKKGVINAIWALECRCAWANLAKVREEVKKILPGVQVIEKASRALTRAEARAKVEKEAKSLLKREKQARLRLKKEREQFTSLLVLLVMFASMIWIGFLFFNNVRERKKEIGILKSLGFQSIHILFIFLLKAAIMGIGGGLVGVYSGFLIGRELGFQLEDISEITAGLMTLPFPFVLISVGVSLLLTGVASWFPALIAARQNPASTLIEH
jgi:ABC-type lipoprotein release transport system permease subunit